MSDLNFQEKLELKQWRETFSQTRLRDGKDDKITEKKSDLQLREPINRSQPMFVY